MPLPGCPLCEGPAARLDDAGQTWCIDDTCPLFVPDFTEDQWRKLAAPRGAGAREVVEILRGNAEQIDAIRRGVSEAVMEEMATTRALALIEWDAAGRPGLTEQPAATGRLDATGCENAR